MVIAFQEKIIRMPPRNRACRIADRVAVTRVFARVHDGQAAITEVRALALVAETEPVAYAGSHTDLLSNDSPCSRHYFTKKSSGPRDPFFGSRDGRDPVEMTNQLMYSHVKQVT